MLIPFVRFVRSCVDGGAVADGDAVTAVTALAELFGIPVAAGTIAAMAQCVAATLSTLGFGRRSPAACAPLPEPNSSAPSASYLATTAKHGLGLLDALTRLTGRRPWLPSAA